MIAHAFSLAFSCCVVFSMEAANGVATVAGWSQGFRASFALLSSTQGYTRQQARENVSSCGRGFSFDPLHVVLPNVLLDWYPKGIRLPREDVGGRDTSERRREPPRSGLGSAKADDRGDQVFLCPEGWLPVFRCCCSCCFHRIPVMAAILHCDS